MQSFRTTCLASQQSVAAGNRCFIVPIMQANPERWTYAGQFVEACFEPDGEVMLAPTVHNLAHLLTFFGVVLRRSMPMARDTAPMHLPFDFHAFIGRNAARLQDILLVDQTVDFTTLTIEEDLWAEVRRCWDYLWAVAGEKRLVLCPEQQYPMPAGFAVLHEVAHQHLIDACAESLSLTPRGFFDQALSLAQTRVAQVSGQDRADVRDDAMMTRFWPALTLGWDTVATMGPDMPNRLRMCQAYLDGAIDANGLFEHVRAWLESQFVVTGLRMLGIELRPLVRVVRGEESPGSRYAQFIQACSAAARAG